MTQDTIWSEEKLFAYLASLGIEPPLFRHPAIFSSKEDKHLRPHIPGAHCKSLLVKDKKHNMALVMIEGHLAVDLKALAAMTGFGRLSFASRERLFDLLKVTPGSVTPFALVHAKDNTEQAKSLRIIMDERMMQADFVNFHPLHNEATISVTPDELRRFLSDLGFSGEEVMVPAGPVQA